MKPIDLTGRVFGRLMVMCDLGRTKGSKHYNCLCTCGNQSVVAHGHLQSGHTQSCGCYQREGSRTRATTHGGTGTRLWRIWGAMLDRCVREKHLAWLRYGGRGIIVCQEWTASFQTFKDWAMQNGYADHLTIDRIDNDLGYFPLNCRWVTRKEQSRNTSRSVFLDIGISHKTIAEWAELSGISYMTVQSRLHRGWSARDAVTIPVDQRESKHV